MYVRTASSRWVHDCVVYLSEKKDSVHHFCSFFYEIAIKECTSIFWLAVYYLQYYVNPYRYGLDAEIAEVPNPDAANAAAEASLVARVVLLVPGQGESPACYVPLAKRLQEAGIQHVFTVPTSTQVSTQNLHETILKIRNAYLPKGYRSIQVVLIGHSLGAIISAKYIWQESLPEGVTISKMISIAGRLRYIPNDFSWFCEPEREAIQKIYEAFQEEPNKVDLVTIRGKRDGLVPRESVHIQNRPEKEHDVSSGHLGAVLNTDTHNIIIEELQQL